MPIENEKAVEFESDPRSILIADIVSSTALYEQLGDTQARALVSGGIQALCETVTARGGWVVKSMGDGILTCFKGETAMAAALEMMEKMELYGLEIRVGIHHGDVIEVNQDIFGDVVNTTARIAAIARANEILISRPLWNRLEPEIQEQARSVPPVSVKGKREPLQLFSILQGEDATQSGELTMAIMEPDEEAKVRCIELVYAGQAYVLEGEGSIQLGRGSKCEIMVAHHKVSRMHARIFYRRPDFVIADSSTNGTYIVPEGGSPAHILRRDTVLFGRGVIYPGAAPGTENAQAIGFDVS